MNKVYTTIEHYMAAWRLEISLLVLKYFICQREISYLRAAM